MRPRIFLRTTEFLWQEGHTAHASDEEAWDEAKLMLNEYKTLMEEVLAVPVIPGSKSPGERFPGAVDTMTLECMTQDRKAIQCCTSHHLGQNFAKAFNIKFSTKDGTQEYAYTTSWGLTTRVIGTVIMVHGDDNGLCLPPRIAPFHVVIIPVLTKPDANEAVIAAARRLGEEISAVQYAGDQVRVHVDEKEGRAGEKGWLWIKKGVPIRIEIGPRDIEKGVCMVGLRDDERLQKQSMDQQQIVVEIPSLLAAIQRRMYEKALLFQEAHTRTDIHTFEEMKAFFTPKNEDKPEIHGGFVRAKWCGDMATEELLKEMKVTIRCLPKDQSHTKGFCIITGKEATLDAIFAKSY
jgi:prolyl-tRNA synthetase